MVCLVRDDTGGSVDALVSAVSTGGTISGVGELLKERRPMVQAVAAGPTGAAVLSGKARGSHQMRGIGVGFVPAALSLILINEMITVSDTDAFACAASRARRGDPGRCFLGRGVACVARIAARHVSANGSNRMVFRLLRN
jgi:cysteine synthase A